MRRRSWVSGLFAALAACLWSAEAAGRVVAVGDIHGAYREFVSILQQAGMLDDKLAWVGGKTILVQTGDAVDRGPASRRVLDLLMDLREKARAQGGEVRPLLGNHETMVLIGDLRYVSPPEYAAFSTPNSARLQEREHEGYVQYLRQQASKTRQPLQLNEASKKAWMDAHPAGFFELRQAFGPQGTYGKYLRALDTVTQVGDTLFLHGGLSAELKFASIREINDQVRKDLETYDRAWAKLVQRGVIWQYHTLEEAVMQAKAELQRQQSAGGRPDPELITLLSLGDFTFASTSGPLWYRGYAQQAEDALAPQLDSVLRRFGARRMVVGHTIPASRRITPRFGGKVVLIDTGMLREAFQGRPSALEITGGQIRAIYAGEPPQDLTGAGQ